MSKLTLTSTFASAVIIGDPGILVFTLPAKETKTIDVNDVQLRQLTPQLEKLKAAKWINYSVAEFTAPPAPPATPEPAVVAVVAVESIKSDEKPAEVTPVPVEETPTPAEVAAPAEEPVKEAEPAKLQPFDRKNKNR